MSHSKIECTFPIVFPHSIIESSVVYCSIMQCTFVTYTNEISMITFFLFRFLSPVFLIFLFFLIPFP